MEIIDQLNLLKYFFKTEITDDYIYLDIPGYFNIGDHLIFQGAKYILKKNVPYKCIYQSVIENINYSKLKNNNTIIILQGGGNWGGGYYTPFRNSIIERFSDNKIILMPQTIRYENISDLENDANLYAKHDNLHLCARDIPSYELLKKYFYSNHIYLLPDTATGLYELLPKHNAYNVPNSLLIRRKDFEISIDPWEIPNVIIKDWDSILDDLHFPRLLWPYKVLRKAKRLTNSILLKEMCNQYFLKIFEPWFFSNIPQYLNKYKKIYTTRLHGLIIAKLMDMPVEWQDTKYKKISNYIQTWF